MESKALQKFSAVVNTVILLMVFGLMGFFALIKVRFLVLFSIPAALVYVIGYALIYKDKLDIYVRMVFSWLTFYMCVTTVCLGYGYGFHLYCFSIIPTIFVTEYLSYKLGDKPMLSRQFSVAVGVLYLISTGYVAYNGPVFERDQKYAALFWLFNAVAVLGFNIYYLHYLIQSIIRSENELKRIAHEDRLTGLYNRHYMLDHLEAVAMNGGCVVAMADIDDFKQINDTYGHNAGDLVLKTVADTMKRDCADGTVARWGGEEFLILLHCSVDEGTAIMEKLRRDISSKPIRFGDTDINVTITVGIAERRDDMTIDKWVQSVDDRLYAGKNSGKNKVVSCD